MLASTTTSSDGLDVIQTLGPVLRTRLDAGLVDPTGTNHTLQAGSVVIGRQHTVNTYDQGAPDAKRYHLKTTEVSGLAVPGYPESSSAKTSRVRTSATAHTSWRS
jgi:hypothetical protein